MSENRKKEIENPVFNDGTFSKLEKLNDSDLGHQLRESSRERSHRRSIEGWEAKSAAGFTKVDGRHVAADGLVSRRGYRRLSHSPTEEEELKLQNDLSKLQRAANQVLNELEGRNAAIFKTHVVDPLAGVTTAPRIEETASKFKITAKRVYNILDDCKRKIQRAVRDGVPKRRDNVASRGGQFVREYIEGRPFLIGPVKEDEDGRRYIEYWVSYDD